MLFKKEKAKDQPNHGRPAVFWGASDRMICCKGIAGEGNEFNSTSHPKLAPFGYVATLKIESPSKGSAVLVHAIYSGHWSFAVSPADEDIDELPNWKVEREWGTVNQHSETLTIFCPIDASISVIDRVTEMG
jgi:hypothetical protein